MTVINIDNLRIDAEEFKWELARELEELCMSHSLTMLMSMDRHYRLKPNMFNEHLLELAAQDDIFYGALEHLLDQAA